MDIGRQRAAQAAWKAASPLTRERLKQGSFIHYLGSERELGFSAPIPFYLFWCWACQRPAKDYIHGFRGRERVTCSACGESLKIHKWRALLDRVSGVLSILLLRIRSRRGAA